MNTENFKLIIRYLTTDDDEYYNKITEELIGSKKRIFIKIIDHYTHNRSDKVIDRCFNLLRRLFPYLKDTLNTIVIENSFLIYKFNEDDEMKLVKPCIKLNDRIQEKEDGKKVLNVYKEQDYLHRYIKNDQLDKVIEYLIANPNIDISTDTLYMIARREYDRVIDCEYHVWKHFKLIDVSVYYGSLKCFYFFLNNDCEITSSLLYLCFVGGNKTIINEISSGYEFNFSFIEDLCHNYHNDVIEYFVNKYNLRYSSLHGASDVYNYVASDYFFENLEIDDDYKVLAAVRLGYYDIVKSYLNKGYDPNTELPNFKTLLIESIMHIEIVKLLIEYGANVDKESKEPSTALHYAASIGDIETLIYLCKSATVDILDNTPLHWACSSGRVDSAKVLIQNGADYNKKNSDKYTPLDYAKSYYERDYEELISYIESYNNTAQL